MRNRTYSELAAKAWKLAVKTASSANGPLYCVPANIGPDGAERLVIGNGYFFAALPPGADDMIPRGIFRKLGARDIQKSDNPVPDFAAVLPHGDSLKTYARLSVGGFNVTLTDGHTSTDTLAVLQNCTEQATMRKDYADFADECGVREFKAAGEGCAMRGDYPNGEDGTMLIIMPVAKPFKSLSVDS